MSENAYQENLNKAKEAARQIELSSEDMNITIRLFQKNFAIIFAIITLAFILSVINFILAEKISLFHTSALIGYGLSTILIGIAAMPFRRYISGSSSDRLYQDRVNELELYFDIFEYRRAAIDFNGDKLKKKTRIAKIGSVVMFLTIGTTTVLLLQGIM